MEAHCRIYCLPKAGRSAEEYEDASWPVRNCRRTLTDSLRFAIADGATESSFARLWARQLALAYCSAPVRAPGDYSNLRERIDRQGATWQRRVFAKPMAWNYLAKAQRGAFATLAGMTLYTGNGGSGMWDALAIGDSCMFQVRSGQLIRAWPEMAPAAFGFNPLLLCSVTSDNEMVWSELNQCITCGEWADGDLFLLMTDALAKWFVTSVQNRSQPWQELVEVISSQEDFAGWIASLRASSELQNDDVTLMMIAVEEHA